MCLSAFMQGNVTRIVVFYNNHFRVLRYSHFPAPTDETPSCHFFATHRDR